MASNWYNGRRTINVLSLFHCQLSHIEPNAFDSEPFRYTNQLAIVNNTALTFNDEMFNGLNHMNRLQIHTTKIFNVNVDFLRPIAQRLNYFFLDGFPDDMQFEKTFGSYPLEALQTISIHTELSDWYRVIGPATFSQLTAIKVLDISKCGIHIILPNTFDAIGKTVTHINLSYNRLKFIQARLFTVFFSTAKLKGQSILSISYNPIICSCDLYEMRNLTLLNMEYFYGTAERFMKEHACRGAGRPQSNCDNLQKIGTVTLHGHEPVLGALALPKVIFRIINGTLEVKTKTTSGIRILVYVHRSSVIEQSTKCQPAVWIRESLKCFLLSERAMVLPIDEYLELSIPVTFYASLTILVNERV